MYFCAMKIFLDDHRRPEDIYPPEVAKDMIVIRNYRAFVAIIETDGLPEFISFDYDLGLDITGKFAPTGKDCAEWLFKRFGNELNTLKYEVHSSYPNAQQIIDKVFESLKRD